jgi:hypothetical protein
MKTQCQIQNNARLLFDNCDHRGDLLETVLRHARKLERGLIENSGGSIFVIKTRDIRTRVVFVDLTNASRRQSTDIHTFIPINMRSDFSAVYEVANTGGETRVDRAIGSEVSSLDATVQTHRNIEGSQKDCREDDRKGGRNLNQGGDRDKEGTGYAAKRNHFADFAGKFGSLMWFEL